MLHIDDFQNYTYIIHKNDSGQYWLELWVQDTVVISETLWDSYAEVLNDMVLMQLPLRQYDVENLKYLEQAMQDFPQAA